MGERSIMDEKDLHKALWSRNPSERPSQFVVRRTKARKWRISFKDDAGETHILVKKIRGNKTPEIREFLRLNGVEKWMLKMEISRFTVVFRD